MSSTVRSTVLVVLQARMASQRLPGKALQPLAGKPLVTHCMERLVAARVGTVVLATTTAQRDDVLARLAANVGLPVVRGSECDVLARFALAARQHPARIIVRATADNPAVDIDSPRRVIAALESAGRDYVAEASLPYGTTVEAVRADALAKAHEAARAPADREHVTRWITRNPERFRIQFIAAPPLLRRPDLRLTVDTAEDLDYMRRVLVTAGARTSLAPLAEIIYAADRVAEGAEVA